MKTLEQRLSFLFKKYFWAQMYQEYYCQFSFLSSLVKPFFLNAPFFYPMKTPENSNIFWCFQEVE